jgi:trichothecene 3-O-acetyltransferase
MLSRREIHVKPAGDLSEGQDEILQLSDMDLLMPKLYVHMIEIFELPKDVDKTAIIENLVKGLERTLADYPILTGKWSYGDVPLSIGRFWFII